MLTKKALLVENFGSAQKREALYSCSPQFQYAERINPDLKAQKKRNIALEPTYFGRSKHLPLLRLLGSTEERETEERKESEMEKNGFFP